jgi:CheY-like chemotaxis protein
MDMQMPVMDGLESTRIPRASNGPNSDIPVLALTANVMEGHQQACREAGMNGHIAKPIDARVLMTSVFAALDRAVGGEDRNDPLQDCAQAA